MLRHRAAVVLALLGSLPAQATFVPEASIRLRVDGLTELFAALPATHIGRLLGEPVAHAALQQALVRYRALVQRRNALLGPLRPVLAEQPVWLQSSFAEKEAWRFWQEVDWSDLRSVELAFTPPTDLATPPRHVLTFQCTPRAEGRLTARFERLANELRQSGVWRPADNEKIAGVPGHVLRGPQPEASEHNGEPMAPAALWLLHTPGQFALAGGEPGPGTLVEQPTPRPAGASLEFDVPALLQASANPDGTVDPVAVALGLDAVQRVAWSARIAGELLLEEVELINLRAPSGLIGAMLGGTADLPAQALPKGALLQLRVAADLAQLPAILEALEVPLPPEALTGLLPHLTGGIALGTAAPATGGVIPRLFATLGLRSAEAAATALAELVPPTLLGRPVTYSGVRCTTLKLPDVPAGLQPAFAVHDGRLWLAESPRSLRDLLAAQTDGATAMDTADAPLPPGEGEPLPTFDLRFDEAAIYRTLYDVWLPLYALTAATQPGMKALLERADLPTPDEASPHLGRTRGVLRRRGDHHVVQHLGRLGGPLLCGYAMTWGPITSASIAEPWFYDSMRGALARLQLEAAWTALSKWKDQHGSFPPDLGALVKAGLLQPDQLLVPADPAPDVLKLDDGRVVRSSYRYFREPVAVNAAEGSGRMLLIGIEVQQSPFSQRPMLADDGTQPQVWGNTANQPIDEFGK
ncbi:MAG: hypothetical protein MUC36_05140 [Planctomycetes bacterium]|jgi:hypothetical protein|nr:hypothetical protein [Planctomycetota bacterium]